MHVNNQVIYCLIDIPFNGTPTIRIDRLRVIGRNRVYCVVNDFGFTTLTIKKSKYSTCLNKAESYKANYGFSSDGWRAYIFSTMTEKITLRKLQNHLLKKIQKEHFLAGEVIRKIKELIKAK